MADPVKVHVHRLDPRQRARRWPRSPGGLGCGLGCFLGLLFAWIVVPLIVLAVATFAFACVLAAARNTVRRLARLIAGRGR